MRPPLSYVPLLPALAAIIVGIIAARWLDGSWWLVAGIILSAALSALLLGRRYIAVIVAAVGVGYLVTEADAFNFRAEMPDEGIDRASGLVMSINQSDMSQRCIVSLKGNYKGNCYVTIPGFDDSVGPGDYIEFTAIFGGLNEYRDVEGDIDLSDFYYRHHIAGRATVLHDSLTVTGIDRSIVWRIKRQREKLVDEITRSGMNETTQNFVAALLLGDDTLLDSDSRPQFAAAGIAHVLALSGMHVAIIAGVLSWLLFPLVWAGHRRLRWVIVIIALWLYGLLTGMSLSVTRAVIMFSLVLTAKCVGRNYSSANALCVAALAILVFDPRQLFAPGFQLSFMAVLSLIVIKAALPEVTSRNRMLRVLTNYLIFTIAAVVGTLPLVMYYFHQFPIYSLLANIPCSLLLPFIMVGAIGVVVLLMCGIDWSLLDRSVDIMSDVVTGTAQFTSRLPGAVIDNLYLHWWGVVAAYIAIAATVAWIYYRNRWLPGMALAGVLLAGLSAFNSKREPDVLFVGRNANATDIILSRGNDGYLYSSAGIMQLEDEMKYTLDRYNDFFGRRGIDSLVVLNYSMTGANAVITFGKCRLAVVNDNDIPAQGMRADYLIVCRGYNGDILKLVETIDCDTVLLGRDINARRRRRYEAELVGAGRAVRSLSGGYGLRLESRE